MKTYKLKKWYPSLPKWMEIGAVARYIEMYKCYFISNYTIQVSEVENNPDFWELIEEKYCDCNIPIFTLNSTFCRKCLKDIEERKPLFVTEDGLEVFDENAIIIAVGKDMDKLKVKAKFHDVMNCVFFKHESNADAYILWNKPLFSLQDIDATIKGHLPEFDDMKKLAEERIKG